MPVQGRGPNGCCCGGGTCLCCTGAGTFTEWDIVAVSSPSSPPSPPCPSCDLLTSPVRVYLRTAYNAFTGCACTLTSDPITFDCGSNGPPGGGTGDVYLYHYNTALGLSILNETPSPLNATSNCGPVGSYTPSSQLTGSSEFCRTGEEDNAPMTFNFGTNWLCKTNEFTMTPVAGTWAKCSEVSTVPPSPPAFMARLPLRMRPCQHLGAKLCNDCGRQDRRCGLGHGGDSGVRHLVECQACPDYAPPE